jgi:proteasome lid subunit RPN8/RPN11
MSAAPRLILSAAQRDELRAGAEAVYPNEFCALLLGIDEAPGRCRATRVVPAANIHPAPRTGFELDPKVLIGVLRDLREAEKAGRGGGERLLGHVHSHPDGPAEPSARDLALAHEPGLFWLVMAVPDGKSGTIGGFQAVQDEAGRPRFIPADLVIAGAAGR